uniref:Uncharacterized protein n=1 Tax=Arundo donax TaxID=35708 RepID=A0A0A8YUT2_ARUDO
MISKPSLTRILVTWKGS